LQRRGDPGLDRRGAGWIERNTLAAAQAGARLAKNRNLCLGSMPVAPTVMVATRSSGLS